jgi:hypothetical protein
VSKTRAGRSDPVISFGRMMFHLRVLGSGLLAGSMVQIERLLNLKRRHECNGPYGRVQAFDVGKFDTAFVLRIS